MIGLAEFLARRRRQVLIAWVVVVLAALPFAARQTEHLTGAGFDVPGSQSLAVSDTVERDFASRTDGLVLVFRAEPGAAPAQRDAAVARAARRVGSVGNIALAPADAARAKLILRRGDEVLVPLRSNAPPDRLTDVASDLREELEPGTPVAGVTTYMAGQPAAWAGLQELSKEDLEKAEVTGFPIIALILLAVFGSFAAAVLPLALGFVSVIVTGALIYFIAQQMETSVFVTNMASMVGIGVAVDYSLFILARFREEVRAGRGVAEARAEALATSGQAVVFSGLAVIVSLAGLWMVDNGALRSMALGAMVVVAISILAATTLLPALIRLLGHRVEAGGLSWRVATFVRHLLRRPRRRGSTRPGRPGFWQRWTERVMARPWLSVLGASAVLLALALPVLSIKTGNAAIEQFPAGHDVRRGAALATKLNGGSADPVRVVATFREGGLSDPANRAAAESFARAAARNPQVRRVAAPLRGPGNALINLTQRAAAEAETSSALVDRLREQVVPRSALARRAAVDVGGEAARIHDVRVQISGSMWRIVLFILGFSFVVLMVMLRSLLLPLKAVLMNLLSIGAAYGVLVVVFQWGWLDGFLGFQSLGAIDTINPPLIFAVVFGLSMDYEVFLLSRIRERYMEHGDNRRAVAEGLASSAGTITSAALIMVTVFAVFVLTGVPSIKEIGLGNAVAIALDATLVRLVLVPAAMQLMGRWNWWLPGWLDRLLPHMSFDPGPAEPLGRQAREEAVGFQR